MYNLEPKTRKEHLMGKIAGNPNAEEITDLKTREEHFLKDIEEASGGGSAPFVVTLTPTADDFSGTMDKTVGEIYEAYNHGRKVVFKVAPGDYVFTGDCIGRFFNNDYTYPSYNGYIIDNSTNRLIFVYTGFTNNEASMTYNAKVYNLTPAT